jgi:acyl-CoA synthetase (AMP-forming)/AMP-acid ligase II
MSARKASLSEGSMLFLDNKTIIEEFQNQVENFPQKIAVYHGEDEASYEFLDRRSSQVAHAIVAQALPKNSGVLVFVEQSISFIVSILAVLKSGQYFIPLDPSGSHYRNQHIFNETDSELLLAAGESADQLSIYSMSKKSLIWILLAMIFPLKNLR